MSKNNGELSPAQRLERMRQVVLEQELSARSWRAIRNKMEDTIAIDAMQEEYNNILEKQHKESMRLQEELEKQNDELTKVLSQIEKDKGTDMAVETDKLSSNG